jgi:hypothetical protein
MLLHAPVWAALGARGTNIYTSSVMQMASNRLVSDIFRIREPHDHADLNAIALEAGEVKGIDHLNDEQRSRLTNIGACCATRQNGRTKNKRPFRVAAFYV